MSEIVGGASIQVDADGDPFLRALNRLARRAENRMDISAKRMSSNFGRSMGKSLVDVGGQLSKFLTIAGAAGPAVMALGAALSSAAAGATALLGAVGPPLATALTTAVGSMLALGQGAIFAKMAFKDFSYAIEGNADALKKLGPEGRTFAKSLRDIKKDMEGVRATVQKNLFPGLDKAVTSLARTYLPMLKKAGGDTGKVLGDLAEQGAQMMTSGPWQRDFATITEQNTENLGSLGRVMLSLLDVVRNLLVASAPVTRRFLEWAEAAAAAVARTTEAGRSTGALAAWFAKAGDMAAQWGDILGSLFTALYNVFAIGNETGPAQGLLSKMQELTQEFENWTESTRGIERISRWFKEGRDNLAAMGRLLASLSEGLSKIGSGAQLAPLLDKMVEALGSVLEVLAQLANNGSFTAFAVTLKAIADSALWLMQNVPGATAVLQGLLTVMGATAALKIVGLGGLVKLAGSWLMWLAKAVLPWVIKGFLLLGRVMFMNPIGLVITAIMALIAGLVLLYKKSETFRNFVDAVWARIKEVVAVVVDWIVNTAWPAIQAVWEGIAEGAQVLWSGIKEVWDKVKGAVSAVLDWFTTTLWPGIQRVWDGIVAGMDFLKGIFATVWNGILTILKPVFWYLEMLGKAFVFMKDLAVMAWQMLLVLIQAGWVGLQIVFDKIKAGLGWVGDKFTWLWVNVIRPVWDAIKLGLAAAWGWIKANVFDKIMIGVDWLKQKFEIFKIALGIVWDWIKNKLVAAWQWIKSKAWDPQMAALGVLRGKFDEFKAKVGAIWDAFKAKLLEGYNWVRTNVFDKFKTALDTLKSKFDTVVANIKTAWDKVKEIAKAPIRFIINTVLNDGLIGAFNKLAKLVGGKGVDRISVPGFAGGGVMPGWSPGRDIHEFWSRTGGRLRLSGGEAIMRPEFTKLMGGKYGIKKLNEWARKGGGDFASGGVYGGMPTHSYAGGGLIDWIKSKAASAWDWVTDKASATFKMLSNPLDYIKSFIKSFMDRVPGTGKVVDYGKAAVGKGVGWIVSKVKTLWDAFRKAFASSGIGSAGPATLAAMRTNGTGYKAMTAWLKANVPGTWVSSDYRPGAITALGNVSRHGLGRAIDVVPPSMRAFDKILSGIGLKNINQLFYSPAGGRNVTRGSYWSLDPVTRAGHWNHIHWGMAKGGVFDPRVYDRGGMLPTGLSMAYNGTGRPERVLPANANGPTIFEVTLNLSIDDLSRMKEVVDFIDMLERARSTARMTERSGRVAV